MKKIFFSLLIVSAELLSGSNNRYSEKLDALSQTLFTTQESAQQVSTDMTSFENTCCDRVPAMREAGCACSATSITAAGTISSPGTYCLGNNITGTITVSSSGVRINLNGYTVTGDVVLVDNCSIYDGRITGTLTVGSFNHAKHLTLGNLAGAVVFGESAHTVLINDIFFPEPAMISTIQILSMDNMVSDSHVSFEDVLHLMLRNTKINGNVYLSDEKIQKMFVYDTTVKGDLSINYRVDLMNFGLWNSTFQNITLTCAPDGGVPVMNLQGLTCKHLSLINAGEYTDLYMFKPTILIDECVCEQMVFERMKNMRIQNVVVNARDNGQAIRAEDCQQLTFDHVQAYSESGESFYLSGGKNMFLKQCFGSGVTAFDITGDLENLNLLECTAKNATQGFKFGSSETTGTVIRCVADACEDGFSAQKKEMKLVFLSNVSVANTVSDYTTLAGDAFTPSNDPLTAVSWRNMAS